MNKAIICKLIWLNKLALRKFEANAETPRSWRNFLNCGTVQAWKLSMLCNTIAEKDADVKKSSCLSAFTMALLGIGLEESRDRQHHPCGWRKSVCKWTIDRSLAFHGCRRKYNGRQRKRGKPCVVLCFIIRQITNDTNASSASCLFDHTPHSGAVTRPAKHHVTTIYRVWCSKCACPMTPISSSSACGSVGSSAA